MSIARRSLNSTMPESNGNAWDLRLTATGRSREEVTVGLALMHGLRVAGRGGEHLLELLGVQGFPLSQRLRDAAEFQAVLREQLLDKAVAFAEQLLHLLVDQGGGLFGVALPLAQPDLPPQEHRARAVTHAPARHHLPGEF